ncbi:MAG: hypothetical protein WD894_16025 [Pirellulales bacterium]
MQGTKENQKAPEGRHCHTSPLGQRDSNSRVTCIDRMEFDADGFIQRFRGPV